MENISELKRVQRQSVLSARRELSASELAGASAVICRKLENLDETICADTILSYRPMPDEVDVCAFNQKMLLLGKTVAYPVCLKGGVMRAYAPDTASDFVTGVFGIQEPDTDRSRYIPPEAIDAVIVPVVAFDDEFNRLGHGGGYYDRYLPQCASCTRIGVAFEMQNLEHVITDEHDCPMDIIVTEI